MMRYDLKRMRSSAGKMRQDVSTRHIIIDKFPGSNHVGTGTYFSDGEVHAQFTLFANSALENTSNGTVTLAGEQISGYEFDLWVRKEGGEVVELTWTIPVSDLRLFEATFVPAESRRESGSSTTTIVVSVEPRRKRRRRRKTKAPESGTFSKRRRRKTRKRRKTRAKSRTKSRSRSLIIRILADAPNVSVARHQQPCSRTQSRTGSSAETKAVSTADERKCQDFLKARSRSRAASIRTRSRAQTILARDNFFRAKTLWEKRSADKPSKSRPSLFAV